MSAPKDDRVYLWDMLTAARAVVDFTLQLTLLLEPLVPALSPSNDEHDV